MYHKWASDAGTHAAKPRLPTPHNTTAVLALVVSGLSESGCLQRLSRGCVQLEQIVQSYLWCHDDFFQERLVEQLTQSGSTQNASHLLTHL